MLSIRLNAHLKEPSLQENLVNLNVHVCIISIYQLYFDWAEEAESHPLKLLKMNSVKTLAFFCHKLTLNTKNLPLILPVYLRLHVLHSVQFAANIKQKSKSGTFPTYMEDQNLPANWCKKTIWQKFSYNIKRNIKSLKYKYCLW